MLHSTEVRDKPRVMEPGPVVTAAPSAVTADQRDLSLMAVANVLLASRRLIAGLSIAGGLIAALVALNTPRTYTSSTTFMPQSSGGSASPYSAMAAQLGLARIPTSDPTSSPAFYLDLLRSRPILHAAVQKEYEIVEGGRRRTVSLVREVGSAPTPRVVERAAQRLARNMDPKVAPATTVITLRVRSDSPALSQQIASYVLELLNSFDRNIRKSQAAAERQMLEERTAEARANLNAAEARLLDFLVRNRNYGNSPELKFQFDRLSREVSSRQQLYIGLAQSYEKARIDEIRDTPLLTVIEPANLPIGPNPRWTIPKAIIGTLLGGLIAVFVGFVRAVAQRNARSGSRDEIEFQMLWRETLKDLRRPWRLLAPVRER